MYNEAENKKRFPVIALDKTFMLMQLSKGKDGYFFFDFEEKKPIIDELFMVSDKTQNDFKTLDIEYYDASNTNSLVCNKIILETETEKSALKTALNNGELGYTISIPSAEIELYKEIIAKEGIPCHLEELPSFLYSLNQSHADGTL